MIILTLSAGRSGTNKLATLFSHVPEVYAEHEGSPGFHEVRLQPETHSSFVQKKIHFFKSLNTNIVHTGHIAGEGFIEHFVQQGIVPNIIVLRRKPREVALSMYKLGWVPGRNDVIAPWYCNPSEPGVLEYKNWTTAGSYQLCYWWACDTERRIKQYLPILKMLGAKVWETTLPQILEIEHFNKMLNYFELSNVSELSQDKINEYDSIWDQEVMEHKIIPPEHILDKLEQEVLDNIPPDFKTHLEDVWKDL